MQRPSWIKIRRKREKEKEQENVLPSEELILKCIRQMKDLL
jgi:hypothetical protein